MAEGTGGHELPSSMMLGILHTYRPEARLTCFESGDIESPDSLLFIGGLGDSLSAVPWLRPLSQTLARHEWSLVQVLLTSSGAGFGNASVESDANEIKSCLEYLKDIGKRRVVLVGHSTGCQDIVQLFRQNRPEFATQLGVKGVILQAPVSDREYIADTLGKDKHADSVKIAQSLVTKGNAEEPVPSIYSDLFSGGRCTISASRWLSLASPYSTSTPSEDFFSSDLSDSTLLSNLGKIGEAGVPACVLFSARDESMPKSIDKEKLLQRFLEALKGKPAGNVVKKLEAMSVSGEAEGSVSERWSAVLQGAGHSVEEPQAMEEVLERIVGFVRAVSAS